MRLLLAAALIASVAPVWGQQLDLKLDAIAAKAKKKAEVDMDAAALAAFGKTAGIKDGWLSDVTGVVVRNYEFDKAGAYSDKDLEPLRKQVGGAAGWSRIINVKEDKETTEIFMYSSAGKVAGFLVIAAEEKELTVVHVQGAIQLAQLQEVVKSAIQYDLKNVKTETATP